MLYQMARNWPWIALRGVLAILFGILAFIWPESAGYVIVLFIGVYVFVDGIFAVIAAFANRAQNDRWWIVLLEGVAGIIVGVITFFQPAVTAIAFVLLIGAWAIVTGVLEVYAGVRFRAEIDDEWMLILSGIVSILFGLAVFLFPMAGVISIVWIIGAYAIVFGIMLVMLALRLRGMQDRVSRGTA